jgi:hypothetical protein
MTALDEVVDRSWDRDRRREPTRRRPLPRHTLWELVWGARRDLERALADH